jgi:poly-gamma-glutamate capsule biosynthesis protein CapA/YwtB (metallophosphatase superfamily)/outer membrane protein assembly factor BamB
MQRRALLLLLILISVSWSLASCGPTPISSIALDTAEPATSTATPTLPVSPSSTPAPTHQPSLTPKPTLTFPALPVITPSDTPAPTPTFAPTAPSLLPTTPGDPLLLSLGWRLDANGHLTGGRVMQDNGQPLFLLASLGRTVYAVGPDGQVVWRLRTSGPVYALSVIDGRWGVAGDDTGSVTLFDSTGRRLWRYDLTSRVTAVHAGWQNGVLAGGWDERLTFLDGNGKLHWQADLSGPLSAITSLQDLAIAATLDGQIYAYETTGTEVWHLASDSPVVDARPLVKGEDASILLGLQDGRLLALDTEGSLRWQHTLGTGGAVLHIADLTGDGSPEVIAGTGGRDPVVALLSAEGQIVWRTVAPSPVGAITSLDFDGDGTQEILVGLSSGEVQAYDQQGHLRGSVHAGLSVWGLLKIEDDAALILADVVAWRLESSPGPAGAPWLSPPSMAPAPLEPLPAGVGRAQDEVILVFLGDVAPGRSMEAQLARYGPSYPWAELGPLLWDADLAVANLECVLTTRGAPLDKSYLIRAHPRWGQTLLDAGLDLVTLSNNHALDFGYAGLDETLSTVQALGIATIGAGPSQPVAHRPALFNLRGVRVALLGYAAARWNGSADVPATDRLAWAETAAVQADVRAIRDQVDLVVVLLHAGTEYAATPSSDQKAFARAAIQAGADLVVGHHPHVTQTVERAERGLVVYSLGDALFDIPRQAAMQGDLLRIHATREGITQAELWPFWIQDAIRPQFLDDGQGAPRFKIIYP